MVYEYVLCVDGVLAPYKEIFGVDGDYEGPQPTVALLATNSQIRDEALPILFCKNTWRISSAAKKLLFRYKREGESDPEYKRALKLTSAYGKGATLLCQYGQLIRRVTLNFNFQEVDDRTEFVNAIHTGQGSYSADERIQVLHDDSSGCLIGRWRDKQNYLIWLPNVTSIVIDVTNPYCLFGCCRVEMLERLLGGDVIFNDYMVGNRLKYRLTIPSFEFRGIRTDEEDVLVERWQQGLRERVISQRSLFEARLRIRTSFENETMEIGGVSSHMVW